MSVTSKPPGSSSDGVYPGRVGEKTSPPRPGGQGSSARQRACRSAWNIKSDAIRTSAAKRNRRTSHTRSPARCVGLFSCGRAIGSVMRACRIRAKARGRPASPAALRHRHTAHPRPPDASLPAGPAANAALAGGPRTRRGAGSRVPGKCSPPGRPSRRPCPACSSPAPYPAPHASH